MRIDVTAAARSVLGGLVLAFAVCGRPGAAQTPRPLPSPPAMFTFTATPPPTVEDPAVVTAIKAEFARWQLGRVDRTLYTRELNVALTPAQVAAVSKQLAPLGDPIRFVWRSTFASGPDIGYQYAVTAKNGSTLMTYVIAPDGKEDGIFFKPSFTEAPF